MPGEKILEPPQDWVAEYEQYLLFCESDNRPRNPWATIKDREIYALAWLAREIGVASGELLQLIEYIRLAPVFNDLVYRPASIPKRGGRRVIHVPTPKLLSMQRRINTKLLAQFRPAETVSGFSGGSIAKALKPHLAAQSILKVDFKEAFPSVTRDQVFKMFSTRFHWYVSNALTDLTTHQGILPPGAPTSPRVFDLVCADFDQRMIKLAENVGGNYTRYADNIFFSFPKEKFPRPLRQAILKLVENQKHGHSQRRQGPSFKWHKLHVCTLSTAVRALGLNIMNGQLHNTRPWKQRLRKTLHHVQYLLDHGLGYKHEWVVLEGMMQFACEDTLPKKLTEQFNALYDRVYAVRRPWMYRTLS